MQAIVLAAGEGSRMRPLTSNLPKVMLPVSGRPLLEHIILRAHEAGVETFVLVVGYGQESVRKYFGDGSRMGVKIQYAVQEKQLGTGNALMAAEDQAEERFFVLNGDILPETGALREMAGLGLAVAARRVEDPRRYGVFTVEGGRMISVVEKSSSPPSDLANAGIYLLDRKIFEALRTVPLSERGEYELTDGLNRIAAEERLDVVELEEWMEIGRPWDILEANEKLMANLVDSNLGEIEPGATIKGPVCIGKGTIVRSGAYLVGPIIIGQNSDIGPNCFIRPSTCIGDNVRVGNAVEVKNSTIMDDTKIGHLSYVGDSVIGPSCNFGAGTIVSNLRHDKGNVKSYIKGLPTESGRRKLGTIMGSEVKTGVNTTIYPGTVIESGYRSMPAGVLKGFIKRD
jgi:UDP-N-acetylglucosamine diphosphorylase / glucose-1-phosphate thymidylyltransferase / UDP-N-acetylgalactosamine diphosphorylase / glucosamine-1-phosphate N-acetyltransferase / galactosamine-1-phosphate N-acetyltransferase